MSFSLPSRYKQYLALAFILVLCAVPAYSQFDFGGDDEEQTLVAIHPYLSMSKIGPGQGYHALLKVTIAKDWHINSDKPNQDFLIPALLEVDVTEGAEISGIRYPHAENVMLGDMDMSVFEGEILIPFFVTIDDKFNGSELNLPVKFTYQPCNDRECRAPNTLTTSLKIPIGFNGKPQHEALFENGGVEFSGGVSDEVEPVEATGQASDIERLINEHGVWGYFLALGLAFLTGLLLSFSPCTYPMVPITVSIFAGQSRSLGRGFILSLFYVGTMAVVYGIMGLVVSLVGGVFGAWLASAPVVIGIAIVFVIFSLSMFGLYNLDVPMSVRNKLGTAKTKGGIGGAIVLGVIAALVVSPCVGPFVAGILLYIATFGSPIFGFLTLFVFAIGLGTLYIIIGTFSSAISSLPGAGGWMESVKKFFGFVLLGMALYFTRTIIPLDIYVLLTGLLLLAYAVFGGGFDRLTAESGLFDRLKKFLGIIAFIVGTYLLASLLLTNGFLMPPLSFSSGSTVHVEEDLIDWQTDLQASLADAKQNGRPVLIDTWATWCANCKVLEEKTFKNTAVVEESSRFTAVKVQLEKSDSPESKEFMKLFGIKSYSLPTTLLLDSNGKVKRIMQGVVEPDDMIDAMQAVK